MSRPDDGAALAPRTGEPALAAEERHDIVVIGGGPAGLAAALGARRAGVEDVLVLERDRAWGGILNQCLHDGFGLFLYRESLAGPEYAERLSEDVEGERIARRAGAMVLDLTAGRLLRVASRDGYRLVRAGAVVLAMGCRERTREMLEIPGTRPAGVFTAGSAQALVNLQNARLGREAVILGSGDIGLIMARRLTFEGAAVKGVFEILPWPSGLERNVRQCLRDFRIPLELESTVVEVRGQDRLSSVVVARVDPDRRPVPGSEREIACDTLLVAAGLIPENELSKRAGVELSPLTGGAVVDETLMTSVAGIFACGNVLHIHDIADHASYEGFAAGRHAADFVLGRRTESPRVKASPGADVRYVLPHLLVRGAAGAELKFRTTRPLRNARVEARGIQSGRVFAGRVFPRLLPSELQVLKLKAGPDEDFEVAAHE